MIANWIIEMTEHLCLLEEQIAAQAELLCQKILKLGIRMYQD